MLTDVPTNVRATRATRWCQRATLKKVIKTMVRRPQATENVAQPRQRGCFQRHLVNWTPHALVGTSQDRGSRTGKVEKKERRISRRTGSMGADHRTHPEKRARAGGSFLCHSLESRLPLFSLFRQH